MFFCVTLPAAARVGTTASSHFCCAVDRAAAPLFHLFQAMPSSEIDALETTCNQPMADVPGMPASAAASYPIFSRGRVASVLSQIKGGYYAIPRSGAGPATIRQYMDLLNGMLNDFSPPEGEIPTSHNYVQVGFCLCLFFFS